MEAFTLPNNARTAALQLPSSSKILLTTSIHNKKQALDHGKANSIKLASATTALQGSLQRNSHDEKDQQQQKQQLLVQLLEEQQQQHQDLELAIVKERHGEFIEITSSMKQIHNIYRDLDDIVYEQQYEFDNVEQMAQETCEGTARGVNELYKSLHYTRQANLLVMGGLIVLVLVVLSILLYVAFR